MSNIVSKPEVWGLNPVGDVFRKNINLHHVVANRLFTRVCSRVEALKGCSHVRGSVVINI